jgi:hypothetical protein
MTSCFEVAMELTDAGYLEPEKLNDATTVLVETLLAMGVIKERSRAVQDKGTNEDIYEAATYAAASSEAMADFESEIREAEIMLEAKERREREEEIIAEAEVVINNDVRKATAALVDKGFVKENDADGVSSIIARSWAFIDS